MGDAVLDAGDRQEPLIDALLTLSRSQNVSLARMQAAERACAYLNHWDAGD
jgi:hypothetical protein